MKACRQTPPPTWKLAGELFRPINEIAARNGRDVAFGPARRIPLSSAGEIITDSRDLARGIASRYFHSTGGREDGRKRSRRDGRDNWRRAFN